MKVSLLNQTPIRDLGLSRKTPIQAIVALLLVFGSTHFAWAEGSVDLLTPPSSKRLWLDTRDPQQFKVYANAGEFINVGSSHLGFDGTGFIGIYRPDGTLAITFNDLGSTSGLGIIDNLSEELAGPNGGGTTNGLGYTPGVFSADMAGVWTVVFDYNVNYRSTADFTNIANNFPWTRAVNQNQAHRRAILAWDITITTGAAGNQPNAVRRPGRVYTNQFNGLINGNAPDNTTSPTFYVITRDGYQYEVDVVDADPFRFPISSNSLGLVRKDGQNFTPVYKSLLETAFTRSADPSTWVDGNIYYYEPQAADNSDIGLINNKIFLNPPDPTLPATAMVVDIYEGTRSEPFEEALPHEFIPADPSPTVYTTWLYTAAPQILSYSVFVTPANPGGLPCASGGYLFGKGGYFVFDSNIGGNVTLQLDINNNGSYNDPVDVTLLSGLNAPLDSVYWDGHDGLGNPIPVQNNFPLVWQTTVQYGEIHIANADVENNFGGVEINLLNPPAGDTGPTDLFNFDHTLVNGSISCPTPPCTNTTPLLTNIPFTYQNNFGNDKYLDEWTFRQGDTLNQVDTIDILLECCVVPTISSIIVGGTQCVGQDLILTATNTAAGVDTMTYVWTGPGIPGGQVSGGPVVGSSSITLNLPNVQASASGLYTLVVTNVDGCTSTPVSINLNIGLTPVLTAGTGGGSFCQNDNTTLVANNATPGVGSMTCTWSGPNGFTTIQNVNGSDPISVPLTNMNSSFSGTYTLICVTSPENCSSNTVSFNVQVNETPSIVGLTPNGAFCEGASLTLSASNGTAGTGDIRYFWTGPNGPLLPNGPLPENAQYQVTIPSLSLSDAGTYSVYLETLNGCRSTTQTVNIAVNPAPNITVTGGGDACIGQDVTLTAFNSTVGTGPVSYTWTNGSGVVVGSGSAGAGLNCVLELNDVTQANSSVYTITKTIDATGCSATASTTLNVLPGLNLVDLTPDTTVCEFSSLLLTATNTVSAGTLTYEWVGPNNTSLGSQTTDSNGNLSSLIVEATPANAGPWIINVSSENGCNASDTVNVTVLPGIRIVDIIGDSTYCANEQLDMFGIGQGSAASVSFTWTDPNNNVINSGGPGLPPTGPFPAGSSIAIAGTYVLEVTVDGNSCSDTETATINIDPQPIVEIVNDDNTLCNLDTLQICGRVTSPANPGTFSYAWTTPNGVPITGIATGSAPFCNMISPMQTYGAGAYSLVVTVNGCTSEPDTFNVNLCPNPTISALSGGGTYCEGDTARLCFSNTNPLVTSFNYTCTLPDGTQIFGQTSTNEEICIDAIQEGEYCCSIEAFDCAFEGCPSSLVCATVDYQEGAVLEVPTTIEVCANEPLLLTGTNSLPCSGQVTFTWNGPGGFTFSNSAPCGGPFTATVNPPIPGQYCLIAPANNTCFDTACVTVIVNPVPFVVNNTINGGGEFCAGEQTTLTATVSISDNTPITYQWCLNDVPIPGQTGTVPSGSVVTLDLGILVTTESGNYCLKLTSVNGCENDPPTCTQVTVDPTPEIGIPTGGGTYCEGVDVLLSGTGTPGLGNVTYTWTGPNNFVFNGGPVPSQGPFPATVNDIPQAGDGEYTLIVRSGDCADTAIVIVVVNPKPIITVLSGGGAYCEGEKVTVSFSIDPNGADSVFWELDCGSFDTSGVVTSLTTISVMLMPSGNETCTITARSEKGCEADPREIQMTEQQLADPVITANGDPGSSVLCEGDGLILTTTTQTGTNVTYCWFLDGVLIDSTSVPTLPVEPVPGSYTVTVKVDGCTAASQPVIVTDPEGPVANDDEYNEGTPGTVEGNVLDNDDTSTGVTITVDQPSSGSVVVNPDGTFTYTPGVPAESPVTFTYTICLVDCPEECDEATVTINFVLECIPPNIITPDDSPEVNDNFHIDCLGETPGDEPPASLQNNRLRIFNRWGDEIYVAEPYTNEWKGTFGDDEKPVPAGTYYYLFILDKTKGDGDDNVLSGYIKVVR
jgi:hypothetical protein